MTCLLITEWMTPDSGLYTIGVLSESYLQMEDRGNTNNIWTLLAAVFDRKWRKTKSLVDSFSIVFFSSKRFTEQHWPERSSIPVLQNQEYTLLSSYAIRNALFLPDHHPLEVSAFFLPTKENASLLNCAPTGLLSILLVQRVHVMDASYFFTFLTSMWLICLGISSTYYIVLSPRKKITKYNDYHIFFGLGTKQHLEIGCLKIIKKGIWKCTQVPWNLTQYYIIRILQLSFCYR